MPADNNNRDDIFKGVLYIVISVFMIAAMNALAKYLGAEMNPVEMTFYRNVVILSGLSFYLAASGQTRLMKTRYLKGQIWRAVCGTLGVTSAFWAVSLLPLAEATTILYAAPLIVVFLSYPILKEKVGPWRLGAATAGFAGVILVALPMQGFSLPPGSLAVALVAAFFNAQTQLQLRKLGRTDEHTLTTVFYFMLIGTLLTAPFMPFVFSGPPSFGQSPLVLLLAVTGILQQVLKTIGYALAPTSVVSPINYTGLVWATMFGAVIWDQMPTWNVFAGAGIIIVCNLFILYREHVKRRQKPPVELTD